jgi:hypothetical protein
MRRLPVDEAEIARLYSAGVPVRVIASEMGCSDAVVYDRLQTAGIRPSATASIPIDDLVDRYVRGGESSHALAVTYGVSPSTIRRHLALSGVTPRDDRKRSRSDVVPCPTSATYRAYALGLVWGDFSAAWATPTRDRIYVKTNTTQPAQVWLAAQVFGPYGPVRVSGLTIRAILHPSFAFLLAKYGGEVPIQIDDEPRATAFGAGYVDAEGSFGIYEGRARFKLDSYDAQVLRWFSAWCHRCGIRNCHRLVGSAGDRRADGTALNGDLWRVSVNDSLSMCRFVASLSPFVRHARRREMMDAAARNAAGRLRRHDPPRTHT